MSSYREAPNLARPAALHTLTASAEAGRQGVRDYATARQAARDAEPDLVTQHVPPWLEAPLGELTGAPASFAKAALAAGHDVAAKRAGRAVMVAVRSPRIRVTWVDGKLSGTPVGLGAGAIVDGKVVPGSVAIARLAMPLADALALAEAAKAKAAATRAANAAAKAAAA